jgi:hypothetical protein
VGAGADKLTVTRGTLGACCSVLAWVAGAVTFILAALENTVFPAKGHPASGASAIESIGATLFVSVIGRVQVSADGASKAAANTGYRAVLNNTLINVILAVLAEPQRSGDAVAGISWAGAVV